MPGSERAVRREALHDRLDVAAVERRRVAHEQLLDQQPIGDFGQVHGGAVRQPTTPASRKAAISAGV